MNIGIIGAGYWGKNLIRTFQTLGSLCTVRYIADTSPEVIVNLSRQYPHTTIIDNYHTIFDDSEVRAVVISTPAATHYKIAKEALLRGKHVFVEKPMTLNTDESLELVRISEEKNRKLMVGHLLLYHPCITAIKKSILSGEIGDIYYLYSQRLNLGKVRSDENALLSFGPHDISVALHLLGESPVSVNVHGQSYLQDGIEDVVFLTLHFHDRIIANIQLSWLDPHKIRRVTVVGSKKMIFFDDMEPQEKVKIYDKGVDRSSEYSSYGEFLSLRDGDITIPGIKMAEPLKLECAHFIECIEKDLTPLSDGRNGLMVTRVLSASQKSLKSGGISKLIE
ncbi:MAG: Gfo/Idh/MocA family oxidoreductase [Candidatus Latescibacterota bacterium]